MQVTAQKLGGMGQRSMSSHNFADSLEFANSYNNYADRLYRKVFGGTCEVIRDKKTQLLGADVKVCGVSILNTP